MHTRCASYGSAPPLNCGVRTHVKTWQRRSILGFGAVGLAAIALVLAKPYVPRTIPFFSSDTVSVEHYQEIIASHGFSFRQVSSHGGTYVLIDRISLKEYEPIEREYLLWEAKRGRAENLPPVDLVD